MRPSVSRSSVQRFNELGSAFQRVEGYSRLVSDYIPRHAAPIAAEFLAYTPGLIIEGARQVGKSTLAAELGGADATIVTLDDRTTRDAAEQDPQTFVARGGDGLMVIDEVQRMPSLTLAIKASIDADRRPGRFLLTGSSSLLKVTGLADSLAGRVARLQLYGLSQGEIGGQPDDFVTALNIRGSVIEFEDGLAASEYPDLIARGAYPEFRTLPDRVRNRQLDDYVRALVERDLPELRREVQPARAAALLRALAGNQGGELVKARLALDTAIPAGTITGYLDLLHNVGLVASLPPWTPHLAKREVGRPKTFVVDSGLATRLSRLTPDQLRLPAYAEALGRLLEGVVAAELLKQQTWTASDYELFHFRDRNGLEVDFVLELSGGGIIAIEVKAATAFRGAQFNGLRKLRDALGDRFIAGVVLGRANQGYHYADRLFGLPISALWSLG